MSENVRDYEVSVWTLQDSYLATLKWSNSSHKGQIQEPKMSLSDDGTESFSFTIPMYLWVQDGDVTVKQANPIWYTVKDGILMVNMRKIKVIFNKTFGTPDEKTAAGERVFEFLITKITETHEEDNPTCSIECEGLAFHELGKQGYKIELSSEVFYDRDNTYYNGDTDGSMIWYDNLHKPHADCPRATVDYWMNDLGIKHARYNYKTVQVKQPKRISKEEYDKATEDGEDSDYFAVGEIESTKKYYKYELADCINGLNSESMRTNLNPTEWYYDVQMDWSSHSTVENLQVEDETQGLETSSTAEQTNDQIARSSDKVYEDPYVSSWNQDLIPVTMEPAREKERLIDAKESNLYNLTQTIAENFEIFCRYEYSYDERYQITGRKIIFYNTYYARFNDAYLEFLNYPQTTSSVSREYDGTDITTKMYVRPETDDSAVTGQISIIDSNANPTKEDYVMNFDYLHNIGTISDEQYAAIKDYNLKMKHYNEGRKFTGKFKTKNAIALQDGYYRRGDRIYFKKGDTWRIAGLITLQEQLLAKQDRKIEVDAKLTVATNSKKEAAERIEDAKQHIGGDSTKLISIDHLNPRRESISKYTDQNEKEYYQLSLTDKGVFADSIKMYKKWNTTDKGFSEYTSDTTDIPDASFKELFDHENLNFSNWDTADTTANKALKRYMKVANVDEATAKTTLNNWYKKIKTPGSTFATTEIPKQVTAKITYNNRPAAYAASNDCTLATDAIGWVLYVLGKASYKKVDSENWKKYVLQVKSPMGKEYYLKCIKSSNNVEKFYIDVSTWNEWVACRLQWCLAAQAGVLAKDIFMTKQSDKTYAVGAKTSWAKMAGNSDSLTVTISNIGKVTWTASIAEVNLNGETANTFKDLKGNINYIDLLESVGIYHLPNRITSFKVVKDNNGNATGIKKIPVKKGETLTHIYLTYLFSPDTYYSNIRDMWEKKQSAATTDEKNYTAEQELLETSITNLKEVIRIMLRDKFEDARKFDHLMGPAMRESYWQPEDYRDYGDFYSQHLNSIFFNSKNTKLPKWRDNKVSAGFYWDSELFPEEEKGYYYLGVDTDTKHYYPCINLLKFFKSLEEDDGSSTASDTGFSVTIDSDTGANISVKDLLAEIQDDNIPDEQNAEKYLGKETANDYRQLLYQETIGRGIMTVDATTASAIVGLRDKIVGGIELNVLSELKRILEQSNSWQTAAEAGQSVEIEDSRTIMNAETANYIDLFIKNFETLTFSYYTDGFDKQIKKAEYNSSKNEYSIVPNDEAEYAYDNTLFARVTGDGDNKDVEWVYKIKYIATTDGNDSKDVYNEAVVERVEADRVYRTVGSRTAEGAFVENDEVQLMFLRRITLDDDGKDTGSSTIIPVLMLKCLDGVSDDMLHYIKQPVNYDKEKFIDRYNDTKLHRIHPGAQPMIGLYDNFNGSSLEFRKIGDIQPKHWINFENNKYRYEVVYPRLKINSLQLKTSTVALTINYDLLKQYEDYYIFTRNTDYLITLKPHTLFELHGTKETVQKKIAEEGLNGTHYFVDATSKEAFFLKTKAEAGANFYGAVSGTSDYATSWDDQDAELENVDDTAGAGTHTNDTAYVEEVSIVQDLCFRTSTLDQILRPIRVTYAISNGGTRTYLDALKVIKENSQPKVTYTVTPNIANSKLIGTLYNRLGQIVGINDTELKFDNVFGYISSVQMDLDKPWEDSIEVKNYTNKFEDLFSSISAQTEEMKKNSGVIAGFASGTLTTALENSIIDATSQVLNSDTIINNLMEEFDGPQVVEDTWHEILDEANMILSTGREGLNELLDLNSANAQILGTFVKNIAAQTKPQVYTGDPSTVTDFKPGDICYAPDGRVYMAASGDAFMPVYDGNVSKIVGASVEWDADAGTVNIEGATQIDIKSGNNIGIAANADINIIGNKSVNIGGATINIGSATIDNGTNTGEEVTGGINIVSSRVINSSNPNIDDEGEEGEVEVSALSGVFIHPDAINMLSSNIIMEGSEKIQMYTSDGTTDGTSAIQISVQDGIWLGSGKGIDIFSSSTDLSYDAETQELSKPDGTATSVSIHPNRILMGTASSTNSATVIRMKTDEVVIAAGSSILNSNGTDKAVAVTGISNGLVGARFTKDSIGFATQSSNLVNAILMNSKGITIGSGMTVTLDSATQTLINTDNNNTSNNNGKSWVRIGPDGIALGSLADMYINTNNIKLQTKEDENNNRHTLLAVGSNLQGITGKTTAEQANTKGTVNMLVTKDIAYFRGAIYATSFDLVDSTAANDFNDAVGATTTINNINSNIESSIDISERIYYMSTLTTAPSKPRTLVDLPTTSEADTWCLTYPAYPTSGTYYYYSCLQKVTHNGSVSWTTPMRDNGTTAAVTSAQATATQITTNMAPITNWGLTSGTWDGTSYGLILGNNKTTPMLIGSNGGIHIVNNQRNTTAVVINGSGIAIKSGGILTVEMNNFILDSNGNLTITGTVNANAGLIGDWSIKSNKLIGEYTSDNITTEIALIAKNSGKIFKVTTESPVKQDATTFYFSNDSGSNILERGTSISSTGSTKSAELCSISHQGIINAQGITSGYLRTKKLQLSFYKGYYNGANFTAGTTLTNLHILPFYVPKPSDTSNESDTMEGGGDIETATQTGDNTDTIADALVNGAKTYCTKNGIYLGYCVGYFVIGYRSQGTSYDITNRSTGETTTVSIPLQLRFLVIGTTDIYLYKLSRSTTNVTYGTPFKITKTTLTKTTGSEDTFPDSYNDTGNADLIELLKG